jgi:DNA repair protein RadA/Sms
MAKLKSRFVCQSCAAVAARWVGRCTACGTWNSVVEEVLDPGARQPMVGRASAARRVADIAQEAVPRLPSSFGEFDRVLGGGAAAGSVVLVGGEPGVGKSTLLLQVLMDYAASGKRALYISGEESAAQVADRARRLGAKSTDLLVLAASEFDAIEAELGASEPVVIVLDSVQTVRVRELESVAGSVGQLREVAARITELCKRRNITCFLVGHVTKDGAIAGPKVLEHLVDTVLTFSGERSHSLRTLRVQKNRFGSATEVGVFEMTGAGMREVPSPSALFLRERQVGAPGSVIAATCEGARAMLVEVQALVSPIDGGAGRRVVRGIDQPRLSMLLAVIERKVGYELGRTDVYVNVVGGLEIDEPAIDLAVAVAVASSIRNVPIPADLVLFGELGLAGELRGVTRTEERLLEVAAMGYARAVGPRVDGLTVPKGVRYGGVPSLLAAIEHAT